MNCVKRTDYLSNIPPELFLQVCSNLSISSLVELGVVYPQLIDNRFWHTLYVRKIRKDTYRDNINWKRIYVTELLKSYMKTIYTDWGIDFANSRSDCICLEKGIDYTDIVSKMKTLIISDLDNNDEKFTSVKLFNKNNEQFNPIEGDKWKCVMMVWFEVEEKIAPFFNEELFSKVRYYSSKPIHPDWESVILSLIKTHNKSADEYIYEAGEMAQLTLFRLADQTTDEKVLSIARYITEMLIFNEKPKDIEKMVNMPIAYMMLMSFFTNKPIEMKRIDYVMLECLIDFVKKYHDIDLSVLELGVTLLLRNFILSDDLFTSPPPQHLLTLQENK